MVNPTTTPTTTADPNNTATTSNSNQVRPAVAIYEREDIAFCLCWKPDSIQHYTSTAGYQRSPRDSAQRISDAIFSLAASIGILASQAIHPVLLASKEEALHPVLTVMERVYSLAGALDIDLVEVVQQKTEINKMKYPKELCLGEVEIQKYTTYSNQTGISRDEDVKLSNKQTKGSLVGIPAGVVKKRFEENLPQLMALVTQCSRERGWLENYDTPTLVCSLLCELGELMELIQWKDKSDLVVYQDAMDGLSRELADITIYCLHFLRELENNKEDRSGNSK